MLNLAVMLSDTARREPDRLAVIDGDRTFTYGELHVAARKVARHLSLRGVRPGDRVALTIPNIAEFPIVYYGILQAGAVVVPLNAMLKRDEVAYHLRDSGAKAYFCTLPGGDDDAWRGFQSATACEHLVTIGAQDASAPEGTPLADVLGEVDPGDQFRPTEATDTAVILYTSGTTGKPKGAELTHANMVMNAFV